MLKRYFILCAALLLLFPVLSLAAGNTTNDSFSHAKKMLGQVYADHRITFYCGATYDAQGNVTLPAGFTTPKHEKRADKIEWEHALPAENFGQTFAEWREGSPECVDNRGKEFRGRKCAEKSNAEYRMMQADMYNLFPAIGAVNAMRSNYNYAMLAGEPATFGTCEMKISGNKAEPPARARGQIARTYFYMQDSYSRYHMSRQQEQLMQAWDKQFPVDKWECTRAKRIEALQGNENKFVKEPCQAAGLW
ncbi:MAG TPA: endonuclease [Desulfovibrio sp.]|uniref:endonuclease n=1 Tax=Desulfovibrio sp. TaxID=885 RepID=UPI002D2A549C|nr:endonuclease [Desulfovibrio sp.]HZF62736.1 endonuclease [Desulfovibrio sp.]